MVRSNCTSWPLSQWIEQLEPVDAISQLNRALVVAADAERVAGAMAERSVRAKRNRALARGLNVLVGGIAFAAAYVEPLPTLLGIGGIQIVGLVAAGVLILDGIAPVFLGDDTPERLGEYAFYVRRYAGLLRDTIADEALPAEIRRARVSEILAIANQNLCDVRSKWPWVDDHGPLLGEPQQSLL